jgi:hypothetical protein
MAAYQQALDQPQIPIGAKRTSASTVNAALVGYYDSTMFFGSLAPVLKQRVAVSSNASVPSTVTSRLQSYRRSSSP